MNMTGTRGSVAMRAGGSISQLMKQHAQSAGASVRNPRPQSFPFRRQSAKQSNDKHASSS
ncbi:hypothetical protein ColLi_02315 [Colletotrichum liriopes]|uniref:Uncharacterized protein n=1 Tax=Colletotrichum liriopes TaxID=708192 RepID=A0AA37GF19_9PEZI|nr:hypothetical protein ColLi_02315 [Colletotrichum liriopes]